MYFILHQLDFEKRISRWIPFSLKFQSVFKVLEHYTNTRNRILADDVWANDIRRLIAVLTALSTVYTFVASAKLVGMTFWNLSIGVVLFSGIPISKLMVAVKYYRKPQEETKCSDVTNLWSSCLCRLELHIPWYPCSLKFCKSSNLASDNYRCGIKTCRKGYRFSYFVKYKQLCMWDEWTNMSSMSSRFRLSKRNFL